MTRLICSQGNRLRNDTHGDVMTPSSRRDTGEAQDVFGGFVFDDVDDVVDRDQPYELVLGVTDRQGQQVVRGDLLRDFFLVGVDPRAL